MQKILLIEDNSDIARIYRDKLTFSGFDTTVKSDGLSGLLSARSDKPDLILLDIMLPKGMNGFDVLEQLKKDKELSSIPVIVLTNLDTEKQTALKIGAVDYLVKVDLQLNDLVAKVKEYI